MTDPTVTINVAVTRAGAQPTQPVDIWSKLITLVAAINPGYTVLPGGLIEDLASTATYAVALIDSIAVETINSMTPFGANPYLLQELGNIAGIQPQIDANGSAYVVFSGTVGFQIPIGYLVSDGTFQYQVQDGGVIGAGGTSAPLFCRSTSPGIFPIAARTVTQIISSVPPAITLSVTNPQDGIPSTGSQTEAEYAALVLEAGRVTSGGTASMAKVLLKKVAGVQPRLVAVKQVQGGGWEVICGGGDPYAIANAIYSSGLDISTLVGSTIAVRNITTASLGVVYTNLNHGLITGQSNVFIEGVVGMTGVIGGPYTVTVLTERTFTFGVDTTASGAYVSGGVVTPNARNIVVNLSDYPDTYSVPFVNPPAQTVNLQLSWNSISPNFVSDTAVSQLGSLALVAYINSIPVGSPINLYAAETVFVNSVLPLFNNDPSLISQMNWTVSINGIETTSDAGTFLIYGDPESSFNTTATQIAINQI